MTFKRRKNKQRRQAALCLGATCFAFAIYHQVRINYHDQDFTLSNFDTFNATLENQGIAFKGDGKPLHIDMQSSGTTITGLNADGNALRGSTGAYFLQNSTVTGSANLTLNGATVQQWALAHPKPGAKPGTAPNETTITQIQSNVLKYAGTEKDGRVDFPGSVIIDSTSDGSTTGKNKVVTNNHRTLHVTGSSGFTTVGLSNTGNNALETGHLAGPVNFNGESDSTAAGTQAQTTTYEGKADSMDFDFTKDPRTLTLTGNVSISSKGTGATGDISADTVVMTLDANLKPTKVDITGSPAKTTIHQEPPR